MKFINDETLVELLAEHLVREVDRFYVRDNDQTKARVVGQKDFLKYDKILFDAQTAAQRKLFRRDADAQVKD